MHISHIAVKRRSGGPQKKLWMKGATRYWGQENLEPIGQAVKAGPRAYKYQASEQATFKLVSILYKCSLEALLEKKDRAIKAADSMCGEVRERMGLHPHTSPFLSCSCTQRPAAPLHIDSRLRCTLSYLANKGTVQISVQMWLNQGPEHMARGNCIMSHIALALVCAHHCVCV